MLVEDCLFQESQSFRKVLWIWILLVGISLLIVGEGYSSGEADLFVLTLPIVIFGLIGFMFFNLSLETEIRSDGFYYRYPIFITKQRRIGWDEVEQVFVRKYSPLGEYAGWGLRGIGNKRAYNVSGNMGIQFVLKDGKQILFGTQKPEEAEIALRQLNLPR